jgi:hypothetical protein
MKMMAADDTQTTVDTNMLIQTLIARIRYHMQAVNTVLSQCSAAFSSCTIFLDLLHNSQLVRTSSYFNWVRQYATIM